MSATAVKRTGLERKGGGLRRTQLRATPKRQELTEDAVVLRVAWHEDLGACQAATPVGACGHGRWVHGHHIIPLGDLKTNGVADCYWFDRRNRLTLCTDPAPARHHDRHEQWVERVPMAVLLAQAPAVVEFAAEVGLTWLLEREYRAG